MSVLSAVNDGRTPLAVDDVRAGAAINTLRGIADTPFGDANWFENHGFQQAAIHPMPPLALDVRFNRPRSVYEFMEPVVAELKLKNISTTPQVVDENVLKTLDGITIALKREGSPAPPKPDPSPEAQSRLHSRKSTREITKRSRILSRGSG